MSFFSLITKKYFWKHTLLMLFITFILVLLIQIFLRFITFHGEKLEVPDFTGMNIVELQVNKEFRHFQFEVIDSVYNNDKNPGTVVSQIPSPGSFVKKGRKIYLTIISFSPEMTKMPNLIDLSLRESQAILKTYGLKIGKIEYVPDIGRTVIRAKYKGNVIAWGAPIPKGSKVDLVVGNGSRSVDSEEEIIVPKLIGLSRTKALEKISSCGLSVGKEVFLNNEIKNDDQYRVVKQKPGQSQKVDYGTEIDLWYE
ncbi:MAG: PASTA domain-containing protein [Bacteroidales bacterium]|nr:PASTA domain-containing protein [Bacteroidales bacterium]